MDFVPETYIKDTLFVGELSLNGQICPISGVLPIVVAASKRGIKRCIVSQENVAEAAFVEQMEVVGCRNLEELFFYLKHGYIINDDSGEILENSGNISEDSGKECTIQDVKKSQEISESTRSLNLLVKDILENYGYNEIRVPVFEHTELFQRGVGETTDVVQKEMYTFEDKGGRSITLRPEGTAGVVRSYIENGMASQPTPIKLWYEMAMYRYENVQKGRLREFRQIGTEIFGTSSYLADVECIMLGVKIFKE